MAKEDEFYQEALKRGSASVDEHSKFGQGGGNVIKSFGKVVSIAGKFGIRQEEIPILLELAKMWSASPSMIWGTSTKRWFPIMK